MRRTHMSPSAVWFRLAVGSALVAVAMLGGGAGLAVGAGGGSGASARAAADPAQGAWLYMVGSTVTSTSVIAHTIKSATFPCMGGNPGQTCSGFEVYAAEQYYKSVNTDGPNGGDVVVSGPRRVRSDPTDCVIGQGTLVGRFQFVKVLNKDGWRGYQGQWLHYTWDTKTYACSVTSLGNNYRDPTLYEAVLGPGYDSAYYLGGGVKNLGPFNELRVSFSLHMWGSDGSVAGGSTPFVRKEGTYTTTPTTTTTSKPQTTTTTPATGGTVTAYVVAAGQTKSPSKPTLTGAGPYSRFAPTFDRAAKNGYPNTARLLGEVYLGDGGATATYTIKQLSRTPRKFSLWIYYNDDGLQSDGDRAVIVSIPALNWSIRWSNKSQDTHGWKAVKIGIVTTSGNFTISFRKAATTPAAFIMNAFAFTSSTRPPAFG